MTDLLTVHGFSPSGNCHKVRLLLEHLGRSYRWVEVDSSRGETQAESFLAKNPNGKVPILERADGSVLVESNAILCWLAEGSQYLPETEWDRAQAMSWLFFEQYSHEPYIAVARFIRGWTARDSPRRAELPGLLERGHKALAVMERHLQSARWFTGNAYGISDIALFAYTDVAADGGFDLSGYPAIRDWLARVHEQPGFIAMPAVEATVIRRLQDVD